MSEDKGDKQPAQSDDASFGSGLGSDFKPLGKRILIGPGRDHHKLVVRNKHQVSCKPTVRKQQSRRDSPD
jgi:hypothetical protein